MAKKISAAALKAMEKGGAVVKRKKKAKPVVAAAPAESEADKTRDMIRQLIGDIDTSHKQDMNKFFELLNVNKQPSQPFNAAPAPMKRIVVDNVRRDDDGAIAGFNMNIERDKAELH